MTQGHNNPPADAAFALHVDELFTLLSDTLAGGKVDSDEKDAAIDGLMDDFRKAGADADKARKAEAKPFDDGKKAVQAKWKPILDKADRGVTACKSALLNYRVEKQKAAEEAARKARQEAEDRERAAQEALRQSDDLEARYDAERQLEAAKKLTAVANKIDRAPTGLRSYQIAEVTDYPTLLKHVRANDPDALRAFLDEYARKALPSQLPGVTIRTEKRAA